jgi:hypothetical protein
LDLITGRQLLIFELQFFGLFLWEPSFAKLKTGWTRLGCFRDSSANLSNQPYEFVEKGLRPRQIAHADAQCEQGIIKLRRLVWRWWRCREVFQQAPISWCVGNALTHSGKFS